MCTICDQWKEKKITAKQAFALIDKELKTVGKRGGKTHLMKLSEQIISAEVPLNETDAQTDALWADENGK